MKITLASPAARGLLALISLLGAAAPARAELDAAAELARSRQCLACHQIDARRVGPPFSAIGQRYQADPAAAEALLSQAIQNGSRGQWGAIPMPAQTSVSPAEALQLARWIISLAPKQ